MSSLFRSALLFLALAFNGPNYKTKNPQLNYKPEMSQVENLRTTLFYTSRQMPIFNPSKVFYKLPQDIRRDLENEVDNKSGVIEQLALEKLELYGCLESSTVPTDNEIRSSILLRRIQIERFLSQTDSENLNAELDNIRDESALKYHAYSYLIEMEADARYFEICLGNSGAGASIIYRDYVQAIQENDCAQADNLASLLMDTERRLVTARVCPAYVSEELRKRNFYRKIMQLESELDLADSAHLVPLSEYATWEAACTTNLVARSISHQTAITSCFLNLTLEGSANVCPTPSIAGFDGYRLTLNYDGRDPSFRLNLEDQLFRLEQTL